MLNNSIVDLNSLKLLVYYEKVERSGFAWHRKTTDTRRKECISNLFFSSLFHYCVIEIKVKVILNSDRASDRYWRYG